MQVSEGLVFVNERKLTTSISRGSEILEGAGFALVTVRRSQPRSRARADAPSSVTRASLLFLSSLRHRRSSSHGGERVQGKGEDGLGFFFRHWWAYENKENMKEMGQKKISELKTMG